MKTRGKITQQTKEKVSQMISQAKGSLKLLQALEQETRLRAKNLAKLTGKAANPRNLTSSLTNDTIVSTLKKLGFATRDEVQSLKERVSELEGEIAALRRTKSGSRSIEQGPEAVPPV